MKQSLKSAKRLAARQKSFGDGGTRNQTPGNGYDMHRPGSQNRNKK